MPGVTRHLKKNLGLGSQLIIPGRLDKMSELLKALPIKASKVLESFTKTHSCVSRLTFKQFLKIVSENFLSTIKSSNSWLIRGRRKHKQGDFRQSNRVKLVA